MPETRDCQTYIVTIEEDDDGRYSGTVYPVESGPDTHTIIDHSVSPSTIEARAYMRDGVDVSEDWTWKLERMIRGKV